MITSLRRSSWTTRLPHHALGQVLVRRADEDLLDAPVVGGDRAAEASASSASTSTIGQTTTPSGTKSVLERFELRSEDLCHLVAGLVVGPQVVTKRADDVIGRHPEMGDATLEHEQDRGDHAIGGTDLRPVVGRPGGWPKK